MVTHIAPHLSLRIILEIQIILLSESKFSHMAGHARVALPPHLFALFLNMTLGETQEALLTLSLFPTHGSSRKEGSFFQVFSVSCS